jgi:hypothetical protein
VRRWHPDRYQADPVGQADATERLRHINIAYELVLASFGASEPAPVESPVEPGADPTDRPFSWSPERVDEIVDSINRLNSWSLLPELPDISDWNRIVSGVIALALITFWTFSGGVAGFLMGSLLMFLSLACIWFPEELGNRTAGASLLSQAPSSAVRFVGWLLLLGLVTAMLILAGYAP